VLHCNHTNKALVFHRVPSRSDSYHDNTEEHSPSRVTATKIERVRGRGTAVVPLDVLVESNPADVGATTVVGVELVGVELVGVELVGEAVGETVVGD